ncbi:AI-2E family transporter [soil metagenome]
MGATAIALAFAALATVWFLAQPLMLVFAAIAIGEALSPLVARLEQRIPRTLSIGLVYAAFVGLLTALGWFVWPRLSRQVDDVSEVVPRLAEEIPEFAQRWDPTEDGALVEAAQQNVDQIGGFLLSVPVTVVSSVVHVVLVLVLSGYWLVTSPSLGRFFRSLFPDESLPKVDDVIGKLQSSVGGYVRGQAIVALAVGAITYTGLVIIGVEYAIVLAIIAGIGEIFPVIGAIVAAIPALGVALTESPAQAVQVAIFYVILQQIESHILMPATMSQTAKVPPLLSVIAIFVGGSLAGLLGAVVAIPLAGALKMLATEVFAPAIRRWSGGHELPEEAADSSG